MRSTFIALLCIALATSAIAQSGDFVRELESAEDAAERNAFNDFSAALERIESMAESRDSRAVQALRDLRDVWTYSRTNRIGAFFDDESANGKFNDLASRYPDYRAYIERLAVRTSDDRILYPTAETRAFLLQQARIAVGAAPAGSRIDSRHPSPPAVQPPPSMVQTPSANTPTATMALAAAPTCAQPVRLESIVLDANGLTIRGSGPVIAKVAGAETVGDDGFGSFTTVTVEIAFAEIGNAPARVTSEDGPFASLRAVRYQTPTDCGVRIRLQARAGSEFRVATIENGVTIGPPEEKRIAIALMRERAPQFGRSGSVRVGGTYFGSVGDGLRRSHSGAGYTTFATQFGTLGTLRGFVSQFLPRSRGNDGPYAALGLSGLFLGRLETEVGLGDLSIPFSGHQASSSINSLTIRGGAASAFPTAEVAMTLFGGNAATPTLRRVFDTRQIVEIADDRVYGATASRRPRTSNGYAFGAGIIRSLPEDRSAYTNFLEWAQTPLAPPYGLRFVAEQSAVNDDVNGEQTGYAVTLEPRASTRRLALGGFYRYTSPSFHAPLSSSFFATLRRMYSAYGTYHPTDRFSAAASLSRSKSFSIFDAPEAGTLTSSASSNVSYRITEKLGLSAGYSQGTTESDPGVLAATNSRTESQTAGIFYSRPKSNYALHVSRDRVRSFSTAEPIESVRLDGDASFSPNESIQYYARAYYGILDTAETRGSDLGASAGLQTISKTRGSLRVDAGYASTPQGFTVQETKQFFASVGYTPPASVRTFEGSVVLALQSIRVDDESARNLVTLSLSLGRLLEWGREPRPLAVYESRALSMGQRASALPSARVNAIAFEDANRNGMYDEGELAVPEIGFHVDAFGGSTGVSGLGSLLVAAGSHRFELDPSFISRGYVLARPLEESILVRPGERRDVLIPLEPAGRLFGVLTFDGEVTDESVFTGLRIVARSEAVTRELVTAGREFQFGLLPEGDYEVTLDLTTLAADTRLVDAVTRKVSLKRNARVMVNFKLRRATARERLLASPPPES